MYRPNKMKQIKNIFSTWYTFNSQFYQQIDDASVGGPASSTTEEVYIHAHEQTPISMALHLQKVSERFVDDVYSILKHCKSIRFSVKLKNKSVPNGC